MTVINKILDNCIPKGDCLIWQGGKHRQGYGMTRVNGQMTTTHRAVGLEYYGDPGDSGVYKFSHTCGNLLCCNPKHIIVQKHVDIMNQVTLTRAKKTGLRAELEDDVIRAIRSDPDTAWGCGKRIAKKYGVTDQQVTKIRRGLTYRWVK